MQLIENVSECINSINYVKIAVMCKYIAGSYGLKLTKGVATSSLRYFAQNEKDIRACDVILQILFTVG